MARSTSPDGDGSTASTHPKAGRSRDCSKRTRQEWHVRCASHAAVAEGGDLEVVGRDSADPASISGRIRLAYLLTDDRHCAAAMSRLTSASEYGSGPSRGPRTSAPQTSTRPAAAVGSPSLSQPVLGTRHDHRFRVCVHDVKASRSRGQRQARDAQRQRSDTSERNREPLKRRTAVAGCTHQARPPRARLLPEGRSRSGSPPLR